MDKINTSFARTRMESTVATLAPAAGAGIGKMVADLLLVDGTFAEELAAALRRALRASTRRWDPGLKDWIIDDDTRSQLQAVSLSLAHMEGEPIKRVIHQHLGATGEVDLLAAVRESPQLQEQLRNLLEKAEWRTSGHQAHKGGKRAIKAVKPTVQAETEFE